MPNYCHNTLVVKGEPEAVAAFVERNQTEGQPLTFNALVPEPDAKALEQWAVWKRCNLCAGTGRRPFSEEEAARLRQETGFEAMSSPFCETLEAYDQWAAACGGCNGCAGRGQSDSGGEGWYNWRLEHWGTKWDASFDGPLMALGVGEADVDASVAAQGVQNAAGVGIVYYKFDTPWGPPVEWAINASAAMPDVELELTYGELGNGIAGRVRCVAGVVVDEEELDVDDVLAPEEQWF